MSFINEVIKELRVQITQREEVIRSLNQILNQGSVGKSSAPVKKRGSAWTPERRKKLSATMRRIHAQKKVGKK